MPTLVTLDEFKQSAFYDSSISDEQATNALDQAEARFYSLTNRDHLGYWFIQRQVEKILHGTGTTFLRFPYPVLEIVSVVLLDTDEDVTSAVRAWGSHYLYYPDEWPEGTANIKVVAKAGDPAYAATGTVPLDVKRAIMRLARNYLVNDRIAGERYIDLRPPSDEAPPPPTLTGDREVDGIIRSYSVVDVSGSFWF
ncbi:MAG: hypothetical protein ABC578_06250 [Candidatus Methanosuratincola petrocarbonis]